MAPRPSWRGYLKLSLVSCPVALFPASSASDKVSFHLLNGATGHRLKQQYVDAETGDLVERDERIKGYEIAKGDYIHVTDDELSKVQIESSHTIDIGSFVPMVDVDPVYIDAHYYLTPDDKVGEEAFAVIREAMRDRAMAGLARVVLFGRERMVMLEPRGEGLMATTLHYAYEVREDAPYFESIPKVKLAKDLLDLAAHIIDTKTATFDPAQFQDRYQEAVLALLQAKQAGKPVAVSKPATPSNVVNLMDALRQSLAQGSGATERAKNNKSASHATTSKTKAAAAKPQAKASAKHQAKPAAKSGRRKAG